MIGSAGIQIVSSPVRPGAPTVLLSAGYGIFDLDEPIQVELCKLLDRAGINWVRYLYPERAAAPVWDDLTISSGMNSLLTLRVRLGLTSFESVYLFGISFGGVISLQHAKMLPVSGLILANTVVNYEAFRRKQLGDERFERWKLEKWTTIEYPRRPVGLSARFLQESAQLDIERDLRSVAVPTLLFQGENDEFIGTEHLERVARANPNVHCCRLAGCTHPFLEEPAIKRFCEIVAKELGFLRLA